MIPEEAYDSSSDELLRMSLTKKSIDFPRAIYGVIIMDQWSAYFKQIAENGPRFHTEQLDDHVVDRGWRAVPSEMAVGRDNNEANRDTRRRHQIVFSGELRAEQKSTGNNERQGRRRPSSRVAKGRGGREWLRWVCCPWRAEPARLEEDVRRLACYALTHYKPKFWPRMHRRGHVDQFASGL
jgi:hypothetical protein